MRINPPAIKPLVPDESFTLIQGVQIDGKYHEYSHVYNAETGLSTHYVDGKQIVASLVDHVKIAARRRRLEFSVGLGFIVAVVVFIFFVAINA